MERQARRATQLRAFLGSELGPLQSTARDVRFEAGFYHLETGMDVPFRWMQHRGGVALPPADVLTRLVLPGTLSSVALRTPEWKLIVRDDDTSALYDLAADPGEQRSLEPSSSDPRLVEARARLARFEAEESRLLERLPTSDVEIELPPEMREALDQLGYGE